MSIAMSPPMSRQKFQDSFGVIKSHLVQHVKSNGMPGDAVEWFANCFESKNPSSKLSHGMSVIDSYQMIKGSALTDDEYSKASTLGWCIELLQRFLLVSDDARNSSITSHGLPRSYTKPEVGANGACDALTLEPPIYYLLKMHFRRESYYVDLIELFHEVTFQTEMGKLTDLVTAPEDQVDLSKFSLTKHRLIAIYKLGIHSFYLPVALAMLISKIPKSYPSPSPSPNYPAVIKPYEIVFSIMLEIGEYFQIQDDFFDYYNQHDYLGRVATDISDNKCSWVINIALAILDPSPVSESTTPPSYYLTTNEAFSNARSSLSSTRKSELRAILDENYGRKDEAKEEKVKAVFNELELVKIYEEYEEFAYQRLMEKIDGIPEGEGNILRRDVFKMFMKISKRQK